MATALLNLTFTNATDVEFRAWGLAISNALTSFGLTKTADTGQVDWTTTTRPTVVNDFTRYEIRQFTDSLQNSLPVFFKVVYGSGITVTTVSFNIQVGTATNGAGVLTGNTTPVTVVNTAIVIVANQTTTAPCYLSGSNNRLGIVFNAGLSNTTFFFVERTKNTLKADTSLGVQVFKLNQNPGSRVNYFIKPTGTVVEETSGIFTPTTGNNATSANKSANYPNFFFDNGFIQEPGITHFAHYLNDNGAIGVPYTVVINGANRTYMSFGNSGSGSLVARGNTAGIILTMLYE